MLSLALGSLAPLVQQEQELNSHPARERGRKITRHSIDQRVRTEGGAQETKSESVPPHGAPAKL